MSATATAAMVALAIFVGVLALLGLVVLLFYSQSERRMQRRLEGGDVAATDELAGERPVLQSIARRGRAIDQAIDGEGESARLLIQAGWRDTQSRVAFYVFQAVVPVVVVGLALFGWFVGKGKMFQPPLVYLTLIGSLLLALLIPRMVLRSIAGSRRDRIRREVPLFVHLLVMLYDAGLSTRQAFANMVKEGAGVLPELGKEIQLVLRQIEAGADVPESLENLGNALQVDDLVSILGVMRQVDRYGGEIREPLHDALKVIEERAALDLRERVNLISGRMTVIMVVFFFPGLMLFVAAPAFMSVIKALKGL
jgi:tight adherence protein C